MGGFLAGSLTLIVLDVLLQPGASDKVGAASNLSLGLFRRFLASDVAGIPQRKTTPTTSGGGGGGGTFRPTSGTTQAPVQVLPAPGIITV